MHGVETIVRLNNEASQAECVGLWTPGYEESPYLPLDGTDGSDQGMVVYFSQEACQEACDYANDTYGLEGVPISVTRSMIERIRKQGGNY